MTESPTSRARTSASTTPPPEAVLPERHPNAPAPGTEISSHYSLCFGCGEDHGTGLQMRTFAGEGLSLRAEFTVTEHHQGAPGLAHGGLLAAAFDETLGATNWLLAVPAVTGRLETDFRRPVPVGEVLHIFAEVIGVHRRKVYARAVGRLGSPDGSVAVTAAALFVQVPMEHFIKNGRAQDVERAAADRAVRASVQALEMNP